MSVESSPKYKQVADSIRGLIDSRVYADGDRLETENDLVVRFGVSRQTIRQAIGLLENEGYVSRRQGSGTYVLSPLARAARTDTVAFISTSITEYIFPGIIRGAEQVISSEHLSLSLYVTGNRVDNERRILNSLSKSLPRGMIVEGTKTALPNPNIPLYKDLIAAGMPIVFINGYYTELPGSVFVVTDDEKGGAIAVRHLVEKGHRKIGGIFKSDDMQGTLRYAGFIKALCEHDIELHDENVVWYTASDMDAVIFGDSGHRILDCLEGCTAVVCYNDQIAVQLLDVLKSSGIRVPEQMAVVSFDNSLYSDYASVKLTSLNHPKDALGRVAAEKLLHMIRGADEVPAVLDWDIVEKEST